MPRASTPVPAPAPGPSAPAAAIADAEPARALPAPPRGPRTAASAPVVLDICGVGRLSAPATAEADKSMELPPHLGALALEQARGRVRAALLQGSARQQAAAWMIEQEPTQRERAVPALAALARSSGDPLVVRWAFERCRQAPACTWPTLDDVVRADPDNAAVQLLLMESGPRQVEAAWRGLERASQFRLDHGVLSALAVQALPDDEPAYLASLLFFETFSLESAASWPAFHPVLQACTKATAPGQQQARCAALARTLAEGSDNLLSYTVGIRLGEVVGWPADQVAALRAERDRIVRAAADQAAPHLDQPYSCEAVALLRSQAQGFLTHGELGWIRSLRPAETAATPYSATPPRSR